MIRNCTARGVSPKVRIHNRMPTLRVGPEKRSGRFSGMTPLTAGTGNYPKIGALKGFSESNKELRKQGGMVLPYLGSHFFDQGAAENSPYATEAKPNTVRGLFGEVRTWPGLSEWSMCAGTPWWRDRLKEECTLMLQRENTGGIYMDTLGGYAPHCYWPPHGHSAGGGEMATVEGHKLAQAIHDGVKGTDREAVIMGENIGENYIDVVDSDLSLSLMPDNTVPIFAVVYGDYVKRTGLEMSTWDRVDKGMSTVNKDAFFIEAGSMFVEGMQIGRLRLRPRSGALSFQEPAHKEMLDYLGLIVSYYKQDATKKFLAYGQVLRPLTFREPAPMPALSCRTYPAPNASQFPALMSGVFRTEDGELGVFVVNASAKELPFESELSLREQGFTAGADVDSITPGGGINSVARATQGTILLTGKLAGHGMTLFRIKPVR